MVDLMFKSIALAFMAWLGFAFQAKDPIPTVSIPEEEIIIVYVPPFDSFMF